MLKYCAIILVLIIGVQTSAVYAATSRLETPQYNLATPILPNLLERELIDNLNNQEEQEAAVVRNPEAKIARGGKLFTHPLAILLPLFISILTVDQGNALLFFFIFSFVSFMPTGDVYFSYRFRQLGLAIALLITYTYGISQIGYSLENIVLASAIGILLFLVSKILIEINNYAYPKAQETYKLPLFVKALLDYRNNTDVKIKYFLYQFVHVLYEVLSFNVLWQKHFTEMAVKQGLDDSSAFWTAAVFISLIFAVFHERKHKIKFIIRFVLNLIITGFIWEYAEGGILMGYLIHQVYNWIDTALLLKNNPEEESSTTNQAILPIREGSLTMDLSVLPAQALETTILEAPFVTESKLYTNFQRAA